MPVSPHILLPAILLVGLVFLSAAERIRPGRAAPRVARWRNVVLGAASELTMRAALPVGLGMFAMRWHHGLLEWAGLGGPLAAALGLLMLDLVKYGQHVLFHRVHLFWRMHRVHHCDREMDATTALRFHPAQALVSLGISVLAVMALGLPMASVLAFAVLHELVLLLTHCNLAVPRRLDAAVRSVLVTPRMHWIHHSAVPPRELDHNYGICFSFWDRLFGTYLPRSRAGDAMPFGVAGQPERPFSLAALFLMPLSWPSRLDRSARD